MHGKPHPQNLNPSTKWAEASRFQVGDSLGTIPILNLRFLALPHLGFVHLFQEFAYSSGFCFVFTVWNYDPSQDSLLQVSKKDYDSCNTSSPIAVYKDGNTKVKLDRSGPFYFISGTQGNCEKGLKLVTVVLSGRRKFFNVSPAPSPVEFEGPAMAPTSDGTSLRGGFMAIFGVLMRLVLLEMLM